MYEVKPPMYRVAYRSVMTDIITYTTWEEDKELLYDVEKYNKLYKGITFSWLQERTGFSPFDVKGEE